MFASSIASRCKRAVPVRRGHTQLAYHQDDFVCTKWHLVCHKFMHTSCIFFAWMSAGQTARIFDV
eukprot:11506123-Karenia_brevis.AAC.1